MDAMAKVTGKRRLPALVNGALKRFDTELVRASALDWQTAISFVFRGEAVPFFCHRHNCGWPPRRATERTVELALADRWLSLPRSSALCEVGAVTPYYWPGRVARVVDPADPHPGVTEKKSLFDVDLRGTSVLSISTVEHIGLDEYGQPPAPELAPKAIRKIVDEAESWLVTFPIGYNAELDRYVRSGELERIGVDVRHLVRPGSDWGWREEQDREQSRLPYGPRWANGVTVLLRDPSEGSAS